MDLIGLADPLADALATYANATGDSDKPIVGLLNDLAERGLLKDTLVLWAGEFGRTPYAQVADGLDHERLTFRHAGRDMRLTDVKGCVHEGVLA